MSNEELLRIVYLFAKKGKGATMEWSSVMFSLPLSFQGFTDRAIKVLNLACQQAADRGQAAVTGEHVLFALALVERGPGRVALERLGLDLGQERDVIAMLLPAGALGESGERPAISHEVQRVVDDAVTQAQSLGHKYVGTEHLTLALASAGPTGEFLRARGISLERLREAVRAVLSKCC